MLFFKHHQAIRTRFHEQWRKTPGDLSTNYRCDVAWPNADFKPPAESGRKNFWVRLVIQDDASFTAGMGGSANLNRYTGLVTIMCFTNIGIGDSITLELTDAALEVFRAWEIGLFDDATPPNQIGFLRFRQPPYARQIFGQDQEKWAHTNVICPFEVDAYQSIG